MTADILAVFAETGRSLPAKRAETLGLQLAAYGGLDEAIDALVHHDAFSALSDALFLRAALAERGDPERRVRRLLCEADSLEARAETALAEAAEFEGRATMRRRQGETELADQFAARAAGAERVALHWAEEALAKRLLAAQTQARVGFGAAIRDIAA